MKDRREGISNVKQTFARPSTLGEKHRRLGVAGSSSNVMMPSDFTARYGLKGIDWFLMGFVLSLSF